MMHLFLIERHGGRRLDLGAYRFNDIASCVRAARRRHPFIKRVENSRGWDYAGAHEPGPYRHPATPPTPQQAEQMPLPGCVE